MNPGYLSLLAVSISLILLASGWKDILLRGISHRSVLLFFICWGASSFVKAEWNGIAVYGAAAILPLFAAAALLRVEGALSRLHLSASSALLGVFHYVLLELDGFVPWLDLVNPKLEMALMTAALVLLIGRQPHLQFAVISFGLLLGEVGFVGMHRSEGMTLRLGGPEFQDRWWLTFVFARSLTIAVEYCRRSFAGAVRVWAGRRREWRK